MSIIDNRTTRLSLPLPNTQNNMTDDCARLIAALNSLDGVVALSTDLNSYTTTTLMNQALALKADSLAVSQALDLKADSSALASKADSAGSTANVFNVAPAVNDGHAVQRLQMNTAIAAAAGNYKDKIITTGATTLTAAQSGSWVEIAGTTAYAITLPAAASNLTFTLSNTQSLSVTLNSAANIVLHGVGTTTFTLPAGANIIITADGASWIATNYSGVSPTKLDSSGKTATTAFVQGTGLKFANGGSGVTVDSSLAAESIGGWVEFQGSGITITLPSVSTIPVGAAFAFRCANTRWGYIKGAGTETIINGQGFALNSQLLLSGEMALIVSNGSGWYMVCGGFDHSSFTFVGNASGYQKYPGGFIMQWANFSLNGVASGGGVNVTFPTAFPNNILAATFTPDLAGTSSGYVMQINNRSNGGCQVYPLYSSMATDFGQNTLIAIGY